MSLNCTKQSNYPPSRCLMRSQTWPIHSNSPPRLVNKTFSLHLMVFRQITGPQIEIFCADSPLLVECRTCLRLISTTRLITICEIVTKAATWVHLINKTQITFRTTSRVFQSRLLEVTFNPLPLTVHCNRTTCLSFKAKVCSRHTIISTISKSQFLASTVQIRGLILWCKILATIASIIITCRADISSKWLSNSNLKMSIIINRNCFCNRITMVFPSSEISRIWIRTCPWLMISFSLRTPTIFQM